MKKELLKPQKPKVGDKWFNTKTGFIYEYKLVSTFVVQNYQWLRLQDNGRWTTPEIDLLNEKL